MEKKNEERISSEVCSLNFSFLTHTYGKSHSVRVGKNVLNEALSKKDVNLSELLRHHSQKKVRGVEALQREAVNELLSFYSIIEIAALIGYIRLYPVGPQLSEIYNHLSTPSLVRYYREYYPLNLPQGLLKRLESQPMPKESPELSTIFPKFISFLLLSNRINADQEITAFLSMLDNGYNKVGSGLIDFKSTISDTEKLWKVIGLKTGRGAYYKELRGYAKFITFSIELDEFLQSVSDFPLFQSACYQYHKYWYVRFGKQLRELTKEVMSILPDPPLATGAASTAECLSGVAAIGRLTSPLYSEQYEKNLS